jgi:hypothetical protein
LKKKTDSSKLRKPSKGGIDVFSAGDLRPLNINPNGWNPFQMNLMLCEKCNRIYWGKSPSIAFCPVLIEEARFKKKLITYVIFNTEYRHARFYG